MKMKKNNRVFPAASALLTACSFIALSTPQAAYAQARAQLDDKEDETIVVTGERVEAPVATIASRLGLTARETPATIEVLDSETIKKQGINTVVDTVRSAAGVTSADTAAHTPFTMRGFQMAQVSVTHNGINLGSTDFTGMNLGTFNFDRVEFLKGPSSLVSGQGAVGGSINFVTKAPSSGPVKSELFFGSDQRGSLRAGFGIGGSLSDSVDFRADLSRYDEQSFIKDSDVQYTHLSGGFDFRATPNFKLFIAGEYRNLSGEIYEGTPIVPVAFSGPNATRGIVRGTLISSFNGTNLGAVTVDRRTLTTNYNVLDDSKKIRETWLRAGFEWSPSSAVKIRNMFYIYDARRRWFNNEVVAFNAVTNLVDRERFFVQHDHRQIGNNLDLTWTADLGGMENRLVASVEYYDMDFVRPGAANFPSDSVSLVNPVRGTYGLLTTALQTAKIESVAFNLEDRLELAPNFAIVGGLRYNDFKVERTAFTSAGALRTGFPLEKSWNPVTGRIGFTWDATKGVTLYGQYATASDVAVGSYFLLSPTQRLELSKGKSFEGGVKARFMDGRGQATLSVYDIKRSNVYSAAANQRLNFAGTLNSRGVEFTSELRPVDGLKLWGNIAYNRARYENYIITGVADFSGNTPPNIPTWVANGGASYRLENSTAPVEIGAAASHVSRRFTTDENTAFMPAYTLLDVFALVDIPIKSISADDPLRLTFRVKNLTNRRYAAYGDPFYPDQIFLGTPRTFETSLSIAF